MSANPIELKKLVKQLQNAPSTQELIDLLGTLKRDYVVNEAILRESKAGLAVGKLRQNANKEVADLAKEIVKKWKGEVDRAKAAAGGAGASATAKGTANGKPARKGSVASTSTPGTPTATTSVPAKPEVRTAKADGVKTDLTGDKTRDKCMELIYDALASDSTAPTDLLLTRARTTESTVYASFSGTTPEYKAKIRQLFVNLKDKKNPGLREGVVSGDIPAARFAVMTSQDMASEERKAADQKLVEENLFASLGAAEQQAETDAFQCGRCKQWKCRYRQAQTRSADEPMTTFVTCTNCNNRWKFS